MDDFILETLWEIVQAVADTDMTYRDSWGDQYCILCNGEENYSHYNSFKHEAACPAVKAKALVKEQTS